MNRLIRRIFLHRSRPVAPQAIPTRRRSPLNLLTLEDRVTPSTFTVINTNDAGPGSLRDAVTQANGNGGPDQVVFDSSFNVPRTISLTTGQIGISDDLTITGPGLSLLTIRGAAAASSTNRIFNVDDGSSTSIVVTITDVTLTGGNVTGQGGAIYSQNETLTLANSTITGNRSSAGGGAIAQYGYYGGSITIQNSTVSGNSSPGRGGAIYSFVYGGVNVLDSTISGNSGFNGGGIYFFIAGSLNVQNSSITGNTAVGTGGGVYFWGYAYSFNVVNSTISGNRASTGGGIFLNDFYDTAVIQNSTITGNTATSTGGGIALFGGGSIVLDSTVIAKNTNAGYPDIYSYGSVLANYSLIGAADNLTIIGANNQTGTIATPLDPMLGPLQNNGGPTLTMAPVFGSPLLDSGSNVNNLAFDQRGSGFPRVLNGQADIGAEEGVSAIPTAVAHCTDVGLPENGLTLYTFTVDYGSSLPSLMNYSTLDSLDIRVTGPGGFSQAAQFVSATPAANAQAITATYTIVPPGGFWDNADNGTYTVSMRPNQVFDTAGPPVAVPAGVLTTFKVNVPFIFHVTNANNTGPGSLRNAVTQANTHPGFDAVVFDKPPFNTSQTIFLSTGEIPIAETLIIMGPGVNLVTVDALNLSRIFDITTTGDVTISGMRLTHGNDNAGGAILAGDSSVLTLDQMQLDHNRDNGGFGGGAVRVGAYATLEITNSTITNNNSASYGGAVNIRQYSVCTLKDCTMTDNAATLTGGAVYVYAFGELDVEHSSISGNAAGFNGGAIYFFFNGSLTIQDSTLSGNLTYSTAQYFGGGAIYFFGVASKFLVQNSTLFDNTSNGSGGAIMAVYFNYNGAGAPMEIQNSTITGNHSYTLATYPMNYGGGGLCEIFSPYANITLTSSIISGNTNGVTPDIDAPDMFAPVYADHCAIGNGTGFAMVGNNNLPFGTDLLLGPLQDNGNGLQTIAPDDTSPLVNAGSNPANLVYDERGVGYNRVEEGAPDIGAYEVQTPFVVSITDPGPNPTNATSVTFVVTFNRVETGLTAANFSLTTTNLVGTIGTPVAVGDGHVWNVPVTGVTVTGGADNGTVRLDLVDTTGLTPLLLNQNAPFSPFAGFTGGDVVTVDQKAPTVTITPADANPSNAGVVHWNVVFSEPVATLGQSNFALVPGVGITGASITNVSGSGTSYVVTASTGSGDGSLGLNLANSTGLSDPAGNAVTPIPTVGSPVYTIDKTAPVVLAITRADRDPNNQNVVHFTVHFSEVVAGVDKTDFALALSGVAGNILSAVPVGPGQDWTVTVNGVVGNGTLGLNLVDNDSIHDPAGNVLGGVGLGNGNFTGQFYTIDQIAPTVLSVNRDAGSPDPTNGARSVQFDVNFSEPVVGLTTSNFTLFAIGGVTGTIASAVSQGAGSTWLVTVDNLLNVGTLRLDMANNTGASDPALNAVANVPFTAGQVFTVSAAGTILDITAASPTPTNATTVFWTVHFNQIVTGVTTGFFSLTSTGAISGASVTDVSGSGNTYTVTVDTGSFDGTLRLDVLNPGAVTPVVTNTPFTTGDVITIDKTAPLATITRNAPNPTNAASVSWTVTFPEDVFGLTSNAFSLFTSGLNGASINSTITGSGKTYTVTAATGTGDGKIGLNLSDNTGVHDLAGNLAVVTVFGDKFDIDKTAPTITTITRAMPDPTNRASVTFMVSFSEAMTGLTTNNFAAVGGPGVSGVGVTNVAPIGTGQSWTVTVNTGSGDGTLKLNLANATGLTDLAGNGLAGSLPFTNGQIYTIDKTAPLFTSNAIAGTSPTNAGSVNFTVSFNEAVTGLNPNNFAAVVGGGLSGASVTNVVPVGGSATTYTVTVATGTGDGTLALRFVNSTGMTDIAGNAATAFPPAGPAYTVDKGIPKITAISRVEAQATNLGTVHWTVTFSEAVFGLTTGNFSLVPVGVSGAAITKLTGTGASYTVTATTGTGDGTLGLNLVNSTGLHDQANNPVVVPAVGQMFTVDKTPPSATLTSSVSDPTAATSIPVTLKFSEPVANFTVADVGVSNSTLSAFTQVNATTYTFNLAPVNAGPVAVLIVKGAYTDVAGNPNATIGNFVRTFAPTAITVALTSTAPVLTNQPIPVTATFSAPVTGFVAAHILPGFATVSSFQVLSASVYNFTLTPNGDGVITVEVPANEAFGSGNNPNLGSQRLMWTFDGTRPTATVRQAPTQADPTNNGAIAFTVNFSEPVTGFGPGGVQVGGTAGGTSHVTVAGSGTSYTVTVTGRTGPGTVVVSTAAGAAHDAAGNQSQTSTSLDNSVTLIGPPPPPQAKSVDYTATGAGPGGAPHVKVFNSKTGELVYSFYAYDASFTGGVRVATGDVNGDGIDDIITGAGPGGGPHVKVFNGATGQEMASFFAYDAAFSLGVNLAAADVTGDGRADIITGAGAGGGPHVKVFDGQTDQEIRSFFAFDAGFTGGVNVAGGDLNGDGHAEIVVGAGAGGGPHVKAFDGVTNAVVRSFFAFDAGFTGGVAVAVGDVLGTGHAQISTAAQAYGGPEVRVYDGQTLALAKDFFAFGQGAVGGNALGIADNVNGKSALIVGARPGGLTEMRLFQGPNMDPVRDVFVYQPDFLGTFFVG